MQSLSVWNVTVTAIGATLSLTRIAAEERHLTASSEPYRSYVRRVRWRVLPGLWLIP